ncbi:MAG: circularly permuted type 2 ATP-grasp protein [Pseudomonadota bacterium]
MGTLSKTGADRRAALLAGYTPRPGMPDELIAADGDIRPVWRPFIDALSQLPVEEIDRRFRRGSQYLQDAGVFYRQHGKTAVLEREWPLSHIPMLLPEGEWQVITDALIQRAELLERVLADLYGPGTLVRSGMLPAELVAGNPEWLRPLLGVTPASGHFLHFVAFEIGRNPDGSWFVLGDRTEAPSGAGFALETRVATMRVFAEPFPRFHVHRLAGFFRSLRETLQGQPGARTGRSAILTPGPGTETYYEHAYIARYLGLMLLEGEDLIVENGQTMVRTVSGPKPVSTLWRRLDASFADPLELDGGSQLGTPGLLGAIRSGQLNMVNALGSGLLQTRAFLAFLPAICRSLLGEALKMPNIATWWCGQPAERAHVRENAGKMMISRALSTDLPFEMDNATALGGQTPEGWTGALPAWIEAEAGALVGQEAVTLSTAPAWVDGHLQPRPAMLRVFAARDVSGWRIMPGGYARIGSSTDATALGMRKGGRVADVWVVSDAPVPQISLTPPSGPVRRIFTGQLPSRAAENLAWLGRYVERAEEAVRMLRAYHTRLDETGRADDPRVARLAAHLDRLGIGVSEPVPHALRQQIEAARRCAGRLRDRLADDAMNALRDLALAIEVEADAAAGTDTARAMGLLLRRTASFSVLVHDYMHRSTGWRFLNTGRALERAIGMTRILADFAAADAPEGSLDIAVELGESVITHRRRYLLTTTRDTVVDLLALDANNPRSIRFQASVLRRIIAELPAADVNGTLAPAAAAALKLETDLSIAQPEEVDDAMLGATEIALQRVFEMLSETYLR